MNDIINELKTELDKVITIIKKELNKYKCGRADESIISDVKIIYYDNLTPISNISLISVTDARTITIKPYEKKFIKNICNAIIEKKLGLNPQDNGDVIRIFFPPITEERRKELVKIVNNEAEKARVSVRNTRRDIIDKITKTSKQDKISKDDVKRLEKDIQNTVDKYIKDINDITINKEKELLSM